MTIQMQRYLLKCQDVRNFTVLLWDHSQEAHEWLLQRGFIPEYGAREMDRVIAAHLKPLLMREILFGTLKAGGKVRVQVENGALKLQPATE